MYENFCNNCGKELSDFEIKFMCARCRDCQSKKEMRELVLIGIGILLVVVGFRLAFAKFVYHDYKCFLAECRITK